MSKYARYFYKLVQQQESRRGLGFLNLSPEHPTPYTLHPIPDEMPKTKINIMITFNVVNIRTITDHKALFFQDNKDN